ncbi:MAG: DUF512 domain-containing protein [Clostridiales bacterium]|nr:DUF512 domain-containing protein [Clostridiales bacterium]
MENNTRTNRGAAGSPGGAAIASVSPGTIAAGLGLAPGDRILKINGKTPRDMIQFQWEWAGEEAELEVQTKAGTKNFAIPKAYDEGFGAVFESPVFDGIRTCANRCIFCFVDQSPPGCRESLYIKDDDYRLSFLQGGFITLTNLGERDMRRIEREKLSPLYVSVHATDAEIRSRLLGRSGTDRLMGQLRRLSGAGIGFHCQVVLCPGYNDGEVLSGTVEDLSRLEGALSLAVAPVGLTAYRQGLPELRQVTGEEAGVLIRRLEKWQERFLKEKGTRFVWLSDEFYGLAGMDLPAGEAYEGYPQWENGVGLVRGLLDEAQGYRLPEAVEGHKRVYLAGGTSPMKMLTPLWERLRRVRGLEVVLLPLENRFFGPMVTVSGLLTGKCLTEGLRPLQLPAGTRVYLPDVMRRDGDGLFLDGAFAGEVGERLGLELVFLPRHGGELLARIAEDL